MVHEVKRIIKKKYGNSKMLDMLNEFMKNIVILRYHSIKEWPDEHDHLIGRTAVVGISGIKKIIADGVTKFSGMGDRIKYYSNLEEAKNYLAE